MGNSDLLGPVLRGREPLPPVPHLHRDRHPDVHQQEEERAAAAHLRHRRRGLPEHAHAWVHHEFQFHE